MAAALPARSGRRLMGVVVGLLALTLGAGAVAQAVSPPLVGTGARNSVSDWLNRVHQAAKQRAYVGTFVVSGGGRLSSARIWHVCEGDQQVERIESLTGPARSTFRRNDEVMTFFPERGVVVAERRESMGIFSGLPPSWDALIARYYRGRPAGSDRVAGVEADVLVLSPEDKLRYGYRVWTEKSSGLVVRLETLDNSGRVLESVAFSDLQLDAQVSFSKLSQMMSNTEGYQIERPVAVATTAAAEGWTLKSAVPGFKPVNCYKRPVAAAGTGSPEAALQCIYSDGLASVSIFIEPASPGRHAQSGAWSSGATQALTWRLGERWVTAVGEVPPHTLATFALELEPKK